MKVLQFLIITWVTVPQIPKITNYQLPVPKHETSTCSPPLDRASSRAPVPFKVDKFLQTFNQLDSYYLFSLWSFPMAINISDVKLNCDKL